MRIEFLLIGVTIMLALVNVLWAGSIRSKQYGIAWNMGARDEVLPPPSPLAGRLARAQTNLFETLPLFFGALLGSAVAGHLGWKTELGAILYVGARIVYLPVYAAGIAKIRTFIWLISMAGLLFVTYALVFG